MAETHRLHLTRRAAPDRRRMLRLAGAALCAVTAAVYFLIGAGAITVAEAVEGGVDLVVFGVMAGAVFVLGALLLLATDRRALWALGAGLQVTIIAMYFNVGSERTPAFEAWGLGLRVPQLALFGILAYLALRPPPPS